jgi:hypothetical protein
MPRKSVKTNNSKKFMFVLKNIDINQIFEKYSLNFDFTIENIPETTKITELNIEEKLPEFISFIDDNKKTRKCSISFIDFNSKKKYKCFWDKEYIPSTIKPIGCPIKYIPNKLVKKYYSELSKDNYTINEFITETKSLELKEEIKDGIKDSEKFSIKEAGYYETDGIFCSFNCCMAFINDPDNKKKDMYRFSEFLLLKMYEDITKNEGNVEIIPAPHWKLLNEFGGNMTIEKFRESFNKIEYLDHGMISIARLFEDKIRL